MVEQHRSRIEMALLLCAALALAARASASDTAPETRKDDLPSLDDTANDPVPKDWAQRIVSNFRKSSERWSEVQSAEGVKKLLGEPKRRKTDGVRYRSRGAEIAEIWFYEKFKNRVSYEKGETYQVIIGFDDKGRTLYCAVLDEKIICGGPPEPPNSNTPPKDRDEAGKQSQSANADSAPAPWPLWDGFETIEHYAARVNLPPTKTLDLGNNVKLELVLIPAGEFIMGTPEPVPVDEAGFRSKIWTGQMALTVSFVVLFVSVGVIGQKAFRQRRRLQYSLAFFLVMIITASVGILGVVHWRQSERMLREAKVEHAVAQDRHFEYLLSNAFAHRTQSACSMFFSTPFYIGRYEVSQEQYQQVTGQNPSAFIGTLNPVEHVSWRDAQEFCSKASKRTAESVRLPTDAEWEYACRAGTKTRYCIGDEESDLDRMAWYRLNSKNTTHPVGLKAPNIWGVCDMLGNVWEWCADRDQSQQASDLRIGRGGSNGANSVNCTTMSAGCFDASKGELFIGFRVVVEVPDRP